MKPILIPIIISILWLLHGCADADSLPIPPVVCVDSTPAPRTGSGVSVVVPSGVTDEDPGSTRELEPYIILIGPGSSELSEFCPVLQVGAWIVTDPPEYVEYSIVAVDGDEFTRGDAVPVPEYSYLSVACAPNSGPGGLWDWLPIPAFE